MANVIVIGAGVVGTAIARELARHNHEVTVIDKNLDVDEGTSKRSEEHTSELQSPYVSRMPSSA